MDNKEQTAEESIRPDFLPKKEGQKEAAQELKGAETAALDGAGGIKGGFSSNVVGRGISKGGKKPKSGIKKTVATAGASIVILVFLAFAVMALIFLTPVILLATIDYGLQESLGFDETSAILEEQAGYIIEEQLGRGYFNSNYARDLEKNGIEVGQITTMGEFMRTDTYAADLGSPKEVSAEGQYYTIGEGELAVRFEGEVIVASDFVNKLETNPRLYGAFAKATDIATRFYYSDDVEQVYKELGLSRNNFARYKQTGSIKENNEQFEKTFRSAIEKVAKVGLNGYDPNPSSSTYENQSFTLLNNNYSSGEELASDIASKKYDSSEEASTRKAASLLNIAVSANEPYIAAGTFLVVGEVLNRARIDGDGPVDPLINTLSERNSVKVTNVETGEDIEVSESILGTKNFLASINNEHYDVNGARNYSRDRIIDMITGTIDNNARLGVKDTKELGNVILIEGGEGALGANVNEINKASNSLSTTFYDDAYLTTKSSIGGNRIPMGGAFLSSSINLQVLGSTSSDKEAITGYKSRVDEVIARRAEADRATLSPFDVSSKNTFLGSLMRKLGVLAVQNLGNSNSAGGYLSSSVVGLFDESLRSLNVVSANTDGSFMMTDGVCPTVNSAAGVEGDIYCTPHMTSDTSRMDWGRDDYKRTLSDSFDENGEIKEGGPLADFIVYGMGRGTTVGIKDTGICETFEEGLSWWRKLLIKIKTSITNPSGLYDPCINTPDEIADGSKYTLSSRNPDSELVGLYSSYVLYDTVAALLDERSSSVATFKEKCYESHPLDTSDAGIVARRSGMSKKDAEIALSYNNYLNFIAQYDPSERYMFAPLMFDIKGEILFESILRDRRMYEELAILGKKVLYRDLRILLASSA